jgi:transposase-like protein
VEKEHKACPPKLSERRREYSFEIVDRCEGLYVNGGKTLDEIAKSSGVSVSQVERWAKKYEWRKKRDDLKARSMKAQDEVRALMREEILLEDLVHQRDLMKKYFADKEVMEKADTQMMYAYTNVTDSICKMLADMRKRDEALRTVQRVDRPQLFLDFMRDLVLFLKDRDPTALTGVEKNFDEFIQFAKEKYKN